MESPTEKFLSHKALLTVTQRIGLEMSEKDLQLLKKNTTATPRRGTDYIDITVKHSPREEAIRLANAIAEVGVEREAATEKKRAERALEALDKEITRQSDIVQEHREAITFIIHEYGIPSMTDTSDTIDIDYNPSPYNQAKENYEQSRNMLQKMKTKQQEARTLLKTPRTPITIHQLAQ